MSVRVFVLLFFSLCLTPGFLLADVTVYKDQQTIFKDTVWSGEILVDGILTVAAGVTLEIRPGTVVRFTRFDSNDDGIGEHEIFSQGTIRAVGTPDQPILFTSAEKQPAVADWGAINMMVSEEKNILSHCIVEYGYRGFHAHFSRARLHASLFRNNMRGAQFQESSVLIEQCRFRENTNGIQFRDSQVTMSDTVISGSQWGLRCVYSDVEMQRNLIENNLINGINIRDGKINLVANRLTNNRRGLYLQRSQATVTSNVFSGNSEHGIFLEDSDVVIEDNHVSDNGRAGVRWLNSSGRLIRNNIDKNGVYALINDGSTDVDARQNWWGVKDAGLIESSIRDGNDRKGMGAVDMASPLNTPRPLLQMENQ